MRNAVEVTVLNSKEIAACYLVCFRHSRSGYPLKMSYGTAIPEAVELMLQCWLPVCVRGPCPDYRIGIMDEKSWRSGLSIPPSRTSRNDG